MTITMNTNILPSALTSFGPELAKKDLQELVSLGVLTKINNHQEHYAIQPCWINDPASGVLEEINNRVLGKWNSRLNGYVVAVKSLRNYDNSAGMNEDHRWLHIDVAATYYTYTPEEGQRLKGEIKKIGNRAAICILFDVFTATVFAEDETELSSWNMGEELHFEIYSFIHRRKGPIIRAKSVPGSRKTNKIIFPKVEQEDWETEEQEPVMTNFLENSVNNESYELEESPSRKKTKKKKIKIKQEEDDDMIQDAELEDVNEWANESSEVPQYEHVDPDERTHSKKKKKKKKSSHHE